MVTVFIFSMTQQALENLNTTIIIVMHHLPLRGEKRATPQNLTNFQLRGSSTHPLHSSGPNLACDSGPIVYSCTPNFT